MAHLSRRSFVSPPISRDLDVMFLFILMHSSLQPPEMPQFFFTQLSGSVQGGSRGELRLRHNFGRPGGDGFKDVGHHPARRSRGAPGGYRLRVPRSRAGCHALRRSCRGFLGEKLGGVPRNVLLMSGTAISTSAFTMHRDKKWGYSTTQRAITTVICLCILCFGRVRRDHEVGPVSCRKVQ